MKILRVNMTEERVSQEELPRRWTLLGNRGLIGKLLLAEVPPACQPLGKFNKLIFACGPLAGTRVTSSGRLSVGGKSPLTGGIKEANSGGSAAQYMGRQGIRALVVEGKPREEGPYVLYLNDGGVQILPAVELKGLGGYRTTALLQEKFGQDHSIVTIGPAGEMGLAAAGIFVTDPEGSPGRAAARGGLGAVMGSKGLKALVISGDGNQGNSPADQEEFQRVRKELNKVVLDSPSTGKRYPTYGTAGLIPTINEMGGMPTRNFTSGAFEKAQDISGETMYQLIKTRNGEGETTHACMAGCIIRCSNVYPDEEGKTLVSPLEYETIAMVGSNLGIGDLDTIAEINRRCNDYGIDTIEVGVAIGVAMEGGLLSFGDGEGTLRLLDEIPRGTLLGRVLGQGSVITGRVLGVERIPAVKGQGIAAHEPRGIKGMSVTYAMSPMGADHTAGVTTGQKVEHTNPVGQMELSRKLQVEAAALDTLGFCMFICRAGSEVPGLITNLLEAYYGQELGSDFFAQVGKDTIKTERIFNLEAGFTRAHDRMPEFMLEEPCPPTNALSDIPEADYERFWEEEFWGPMEEIW